MSWVKKSFVPTRLMDDIRYQGRDDDGWKCGCLSSRDNLLVWFCQYHEGYFDALREMEEQR